MRHRGYFGQLGVGFEMVYVQMHYFASLYIENKHIVNTYTLNVMSLIAQIYTTSSQFVSLRHE